MVDSSSPIRHGVSLRLHNTLGFEQRAERFVTVTDEVQLKDCLAQADRAGWPVLVLGGGSNLVLTRDVPGLVLHMAERQVIIRDAPDGGHRVSATAGVGWHDLVQTTLDAGLAGLENLSLIPGTVGAAPVQNIGAYGVELADRLHSVRALHRPSGEIHVFGEHDCQFAYRNSRFKREPGEWIVLGVELALRRDLPLSIDYAALAERLAQSQVERIDALAVSQAVIAIRREKLPDPDILANAGSFFHNPIVESSRADELQERYPDIVRYPQPDGRVKLAAGWMIDRLGFRGLRRGAVGVHDRQALVLVHHGEGNGRELMNLVEEVQSAVRDAFAIDLTIEPTVV